MHSDGGEKIYAATGLGFDDSKVGWHHCPPGMGIYQEVYVEGRSAVSIADILFSPWRTWRMQAAGLRSAPPVR
ncbi:MAG: hypothetical protein ACLR23_11105 [Clostridia bacterium]